MLPRRATATTTQRGLLNLPRARPPGCSWGLAQNHQQLSPCAPHASHSFRRNRNTNPGGRTPPRAPGAEWRAPEHRSREAQRAACRSAAGRRSRQPLEAASAALPGPVLGRAPLGARRPRGRHFRSPLGRAGTQPRAPRRARGVLPEVWRALSKGCSTVCHLCSGEKGRANRLRLALTPTPSPSRS